MKGSMETFLCISHVLVMCWHSTPCNLMRLYPECNLPISKLCDVFTAIGRGVCVCARARALSNNKLIKRHFGKLIN